MNDPSLRSGMNCRAEIIVEQHADAVYVPVQAVVRVGGQPTVSVLKADGQTRGAARRDWPERQHHGRNRQRPARRDELVRLTPALKTATAEPGWRLAAIRDADVNGIAQQIREKLRAANGPAPIVPRQGNSSPEQERTMQ